jgi:diacylglycerol kinase (ATP)
MKSCFSFCGTKNDYHLIETKEITRRLNTNFCIFINKKSGGRQGQETIKELSSFDNCFVFDLDNFRGVTNDQALQNLQHELKRLSMTDKETRLIVGGGDGTIAWIYDILDRVNMDKVLSCAIIPLGIGNELSRYVREKNKISALEWLRQEIVLEISLTTV